MKLLTLKEVAPMVRLSVRTCHNRLSAGTFPIARVPGEYHAKFTERDVIAYVQRGEVTNPLAVRTPRRRAFFGKARKSA